jgi:hypothetical protein
MLVTWAGLATGSANDVLVTGCVVHVHGWLCAALATGLDGDGLSMVCSVHGGGLVMYWDGCGLCCLCSGLAGFRLGWPWVGLSML